MPTITDVADQLIAADLPVMFLDTCIVLDVIRAVRRRYVNCVAKASELHTAVTVAPAQCSLVISHLVRHEWGVHEPELLSEARKHLAEMEDQSGHFHDACAVLGIVPGFARANYAAHGMADQLRDLSRQLLDAGIEVTPDDACSGRAINRVIHNIPPSKKGGEAKDCTILEEYLAICQILQAAGFVKKRVFCTSNTNDFCEAGALHPLLAADFAAVSLRFTSNLPWGFHDVTH
ncbi:MAG TPA: hypothetical protein PK867_21180 [Pirellulales bacterium]|nr:hypothetical protein [Pirellulales bacterium]